MMQVDGITDNTIVAEKFAKHYEKVCSPLNLERSNQIKEKYTELRSRYTGTPILENQLFDVELVSKLISKMANGKAVGLDKLSSEHLKYSHPIVICVGTKLLFGLQLSFSLILDSLYGAFWRCSRVRL